jgi:hypothetical protein
MKMRHLAISVTLTLLCAMAPARAAAQGWVSGIALLPSSPKTLDRVQIAVTVYGCVAFLQPPDVAASTIRIDASTYQCPPGAPFGVYVVRFVVGPLAAGSYTLTVYLDQSPGGSSDFAVTQELPSSVLFLDQGRFQLTVTVHDPRTPALAFATPLSPEAGYFYFFDPANVELTVKVLDGRPVNGHFWVFVASMTDLGFTLAVNDAITNISRTYVSPSSTNQNFIDLNTF